MAYIEGELNLNGYGSNNGNMWNDGIWAILLLALLGNRGFGFGGGYGGGAGFVSGDALGYELGKVATTNDVASGFNNSAVLSSLNDIKLGQAQAINYNNQGFAGINTAISNSTSTLGYNMLQGFHGVDNAICSLGYNLTHQISDCCCGVKSAIADLKYSNEAQTCQILTSQANQTQRIIDYLTNDKIESLRAENVALKGRLSNDAQSAYIINQLSPCPKPAYIVPNPNCCYSACGNTISGVL